MNHSMDDCKTCYVALSVLLVLLTGKLLFRHFQARSKTIPPGPLSLPVIGNLHYLKPPLHRTFHRLSQTYGPIFSLRFGSRLVVIVSSPSAVQECFTKHDIVLANRPRLLTGKYIGYDYTVLTVAPYGDHWRNLRRIGSIEIFSANRMNAFAGMRKDEIKMLLNKLKLSAGDYSSGGFAKVELKSKFYEMTFNTVMRMVSGKRYYGDDCDVTDVQEARQFRQIIKEVISFGGANNLEDFSTILRWLDFGGIQKKLRSLAKSVDAFMQGLIDEHRSKKANSESIDTMIHHLLSLQEEQPEYYTDEIIKGFIMVILIAGTDTSAVTLEWAMANLLNNPEVLEKARVEIDSVVGQSRLMDESDVSQLPYLQNIIFETLRLYPAAPMLLPHYSSQDCSIEGYEIPKDTIVLINAWAMHRDEKHWDEATVFKPERFENSRGSGGSEAVGKLMAFGIGRRSCPGEALAQRTVGLSLGLLIQCFEWKKVSEDEIDMSEGRGGTMPKAIPLEALCKPRPIICNQLT